MDDYEERQQNDDEFINQDQVSQSDNVPIVAYGFKKRNEIRLILLLVQAVLCLTCKFIWPTVNEECNFDSTTFNTLFLYICLTIETSLRLALYLVVTNDEQITRPRNNLFEVFLSLVYLTWLLVIRSDLKFNKPCLVPPSYSLIVFILLLVFVSSSDFIGWLLIILILALFGYFAGYGLYMTIMLVYYLCKEYPAVAVVFFSMLCLLSFIYYCCKR